MIQPPAYFEPIRRRAEQRWEQLESDPELAGPWHQLFKQVQSPRHVLSELLQNADDAGATEAFVDLSDGLFVFGHNGEDFTEEHFASLCRFGYSNKRALHTIGFRGIGFKSTFSLGDTVELLTPTLSVAFDRKRFSSPRWLSQERPATRHTRIRVEAVDALRTKEIRRNLDDWLISPVSLLFFKNIRHIRIDSHEVHWDSLGPGPVPESEWMALNGEADDSFLVIRSGSENFPDEALAEIRQERLLSADQDIGFPPCKVEIVVGAKGRLYVVLPTGVETSLPFACNAPFIQDPARLKIKDPETSPTNRWLLERVGKLAATAMLEWLNSRDASVADRSAAYGVLPELSQEVNSLEGGCAAIVENSFEEAIDDCPFLLTNDGELKPAEGCIVAPEELFAVWPSEQAVKLFDDEGRPPLSAHVSATDREKLIDRGVVEEIGKWDVLNVLQTKHLPRPETWRQLLCLWTYLAPELTGYSARNQRRQIRLIPVQGKDVLYAADEVVRLAEKRLLHSEDDWTFLSTHLLVLNQNWPRFLAEQRRLAEERNDRDLEKEVGLAFAVLSALQLEDSSDINDIVDQVASEFFSKKKVSFEQCVQLTQIAAKLGATVGSSFHFVTRDMHFRQSTSGVLFDHDRTLEGYFDQAWCAIHLLHPSYTKTFRSCTSEEWITWVNQGRSGLLVFAPLISIRKSMFGRMKFADELVRRGLHSNPYYSYVTNQFLFEDWDFEEGVWSHWTALANEDPAIWGRILERILEQPDAPWLKAKSARALQMATTGSTRAVTSESLLPAWILRLRELPCLRDTRGFTHIPADLLRRTPETEALMDVEPFVHGRLDTEASRPLLILLGVRNMPTGPGRLLDRLRALAQTPKPPAHEVEKWYRRLDQLADTCSTDELANIKQAFHDEKIIYTEDGTWTNTSGAFLYQDEDDVPGAPTIRAGVRDLTLWTKVGVAQRPTAELAIQWLMELPSSKGLTQDDARRVKSLLTRHASRIWNECGHWLNLAGEWVPSESLAYGLSMQSLVAWSHLHEWVKQRTADLQRLPVETTEAAPFSALPPLAAYIEDRFHHTVVPTSAALHPAWLNQLGLELRRIELDDQPEMDRIRKLAADLAVTAWQIAPGLEIIPYIEGIPAGMPRRTEVFWLDKTLYVEDRPSAKLARVVAQELSRAFRKQEIGDAIKMCYERSAVFVTDYMEENFTLASAATIAEPPAPIKGTGEEHPPRPTDPHPLDTGADGGTEERPTEPEGMAIPIDEPDSGGGTDDGTGQADPQTPPVVQPKPKEPAKPSKPSIMERFARSQGFKRDGDDRYFHPDGSWIAKAHGSRFPWERRVASGDFVRYYWPKDHCLEQEPLQIDADVWGLLDQAPESYALVLVDSQGDPIEIPGSRLRAMCNGGEITLYPATYRLVFQNDDSH